MAEFSINLIQLNFSVASKILLTGVKNANLYAEKKDGSAAESVAKQVLQQPPVWFIFSMPSVPEKTEEPKSLTETGAALTLPLHTTAQMVLGNKRFPR